LSADALTKKARKLVPQTIYHHFPMNTVDLTISTSHYPYVYFCTKHSWTSKVIDRVWWHAHHKALNSNDAVEAHAYANLLMTIGEPTNEAGTMKRRDCHNVHVA
jgi:hypothetical protein